MQQQFYQIEPGIPADTNELERLYDMLNESLSRGVNYPGWKKGLYPIRETAETGIRKHTLFVARTQGRIAGTVILNHEPESAYAGANWTIEAEDKEVFVVHTLAVHPDFQQAGVGRALIEFSKQLAQQKGMKAVRLDVRSGNLPALRLYESCGFRYVQTVDLGLNLPGLVWFDLYEYNLGQRSSAESVGKPSIP
ncbi:MAG: GNAT family N-acetyltransferase [Ruminococcaceae bacterium]|nr:GNAT family N-acetyltransferase [Oscillospiraceae bacterium]